VLIHPQFNPVALQLGPVSIHWYGLMYLAGFAMFITLGRLRIRRGNSPLSTSELEDLLLYGVVGVVLGGRLGYVLFYKPMDYAAHPLDILKVWEGGMSFHGGLLGVIVALWLYARRHHITFLTLSDFVAPLVPLGLAAGRLGNFINGELWGRETNPSAPWAMVFPQAHDGLARHPSQLYEFALEGLALFALLWLFSSKPRRQGEVSAVFLMGYGLARFTVEFTREPDNFLGLLSLGLSMGQWLCLPMLVAGVMVWRFASKDQIRLT
jgi:phosphatidylglycerol:prolipoprotein diacylglycerol transferase